MGEQMTLYTIDGDYGLASLDFECLKSILYAKVTEAPVKVSPLNTRTSCAFYSAPTLKSDSTKVTGFSEIAKHLKETFSVDIDSGLTAKQKSETLAITNLLSLKLGPAYEFLHWVDEPNCSKLLRWHMKAMPFPFNHIFTRRKRANALNLVEIRYPLDSVDDDGNRELLKEFVTSAATLCLVAISSRLGNSSYFYGDTPTTLDITVYAYIAPFIKFPFPTNEMNALFSMWPNLVEFVKRIDAKYLSEFITGIKYLKEEQVIKASDDDVSYAGIFIITSVTIMLSMNLAMKKGLISVNPFRFLW